MFPTLPTSAPLALAFAAGYIVTYAGSNILFKYTSLAEGKWTAFFLFVAANAIGFLGSICMPFAQRGQNPNVVFAICTGGGFVALQMTSYFIFRPEFSPMQIAGILLITTGVMVLVMSPGAASAH